MGLLESVHLYRKVPTDLTDATRLGGFISLMCAALMAYLFISNVQEYLTVTTSTDVALDDSGDIDMRIYFNITMERLPCQFASVDVFDVMGTSLTNVSQHIVKFKVAPESDHRQEWYRDTKTEIETEELDADELDALYEEGDAFGPTGTVATLDDTTFERIVNNHDLVLVAFGAPWCPWSQKLEPVWLKTAQLIHTKPYAGRVRLGKVDCTSSTAHSTCQKHHIHAFPTIRIFRNRQLHSHENYLGNRDSSAFVEFIEEALPKQGQAAAKMNSNIAEGHSLDGEGCRLTGSLHISRVPGNFRIAAQSESHSFNTRVMNVSHHIDKLVFVNTSPGGADSGRFVKSGATSRKARDLLSFETRSSILRSSFMMHQELATLKHYLKVVPFHYRFLNGDLVQTYNYKANYNEYRPRKLEWFEGRADAHVDTQMIPNAVFHYDVSPVKVLMVEETQGFAAFVTKICAVIGGIYTVVGLIDNVIYHSGQQLKKM